MKVEEHAFWLLRLSSYSYAFAPANFEWNK